MKASIGTVGGIWEPFKPQHQLLLFITKAEKRTWGWRNMPESSRCHFPSFASLSATSFHSSRERFTFLQSFPEKKAPPVMPPRQFDPFGGTEAGCFQGARGHKSAVAINNRNLFKKEKILRTLPFSWPCVREARPQARQLGHLEWRFSKPLLTGG